MNQEILSSRYGVKQSNPKRLRVFAAVGITALVLGTAYFALGTSQQFSYEDIGYRVVSDYRVEVDIEITKPIDQALVCSVQALNNQFAVIGWKEFEFEPSQFMTLRHTVTLNTTEQAVTGLVDECRLR